MIGRVIFVLWFARVAALGDWQVVSNATEASTLLGLAQGAGQYMAAGIDRRFWVSSNGLEWVAREAPPDYFVFTDVVFADGKFVLIGHKPLVVLPSGEMMPGIFEGGYFPDAVAYGLGKFVAVQGSNDHVNAPPLRNEPVSFLSTNGLDWHRGGLLPVTFLDRIQDIIFAGGQFVAVSSIGMLLTSRDGTNWISRVPASGGVVRSVAYGNDMWVASGGQRRSSEFLHKVFVSRDGVRWQAHTIPAAFMELEFALGLFLGITWHGEFRLSRNGTDWWTHSSSGIFGASEMVYADGRAVIMQRQNILARSGPLFALNILAGSASEWRVNILWDGPAVPTFELESSTNLLHWQSLGPVSDGSSSLPVRSNGDLFLRARWSDHQ